MKIFLAFMMVLIGRALAMLSVAEDIEGYGYNNYYYPVEVQMTCSQVNQQVLCGFDFTNNAKEDYYILKRDTPLDGLNSPYLTISQGNYNVKYEGIIALMDVPNKNDFAFIQAGETVTASIDLTSSYKFTRDGIYTVEYTRPLVYISSQEISMMSNEDLLQTSHYEDLVVSTEVEVMNSHNLEPTLAEIESAKEEYTSSKDETVYINDDRCSDIGYTSPDGENNFSEGTKCVIKKIQRKLCSKKYGLPKTLTSFSKTETYYKEWFGRVNDQRKNKVYKVLKDIYLGISKPSETIKYSNGGDCESTWFAFTYARSPNRELRKIFLCPLFYKTSDFSSDATRHSKFQVIAHELSHIFGDTTDEEVHGVVQYGYNAATTLAKNSPEQAIKNADNYAYFIQDIYEKFYE